MSSRRFPPPDGWQLAEAATALIGATVNPGGRAASLDAEKDCAGGTLLHAIAIRQDLILTGRYPTSPPDAARVRIPRELYQSDYVFELRIQSNSVRLEHHAEGKEGELHDVRVVHVASPTPPADFPVEAADSEPVARAVARLTDPDAMKAYVDTQVRLRREGRWHYDLDHRDDRRFDTLSDLDAHGHALFRECIRLSAAITDAVRTKLALGELTAWGRDGSPLAPPREIPATAWPLLRFTNLNDGTAQGPNTSLFDLHIGQRFRLPKIREIAPRTATAQPAAPAPRSNKGGRPARDDWQTFDHEVSTSLTRRWEHDSFGISARYERVGGREHGTAARRPND